MCKYGYFHDHAATSLRHLCTWNPKTVYILLWQLMFDLIRVSGIDFDSLHRLCEIHRYLKNRTIFVESCALTSLLHLTEHASIRRFLAYSWRRWKPLFCLLFCKGKKNWWKASGNRLGRSRGLAGEPPLLLPFSASSSELSSNTR